MHSKCFILAAIAPLAFAKIRGSRSIVNRNLDEVVEVEPGNFTENSTKVVEVEFGNYIMNYTEVIEFEFGNFTENSTDDNVVVEEDATIEIPKEDVGDDLGDDLISNLQIPDGVEITAEVKYVKGRKSKSAKHSKSKLTKQKSEKSEKFGKA